MLPKQFKLDLRSDKDFFNFCERVHSPYFSFFYKKNKKKGLRITIIVPKKIVKLTTERNKIKRKFYFFFKKIIENNKINNNVDLALVVNKKSIKESSNILIKKIEERLFEI